MSNIIILSIDPGWTNVGVGFVQLNSKTKEFRKKFYSTSLENLEHTCSDPIKITKAVYNFVAAIDYEHKIRDIENVCEFNLLIENQTVFRRNRQLEDIMISVVYTYFTDFIPSFPHITVFRYTPVKIKKFLGLQCKGDHAAHKSDMINYVNTSDAEINQLFKGSCGQDDHAADCIGLTEYYFSTHIKNLNKLTSYKEIE